MADDAELEKTFQRLFLSESHRDMEVLRILRNQPVAYLVNRVLVRDTELSEIERLKCLVAILGTCNQQLEILVRKLAALQPAPSIIIHNRCEVCGNSMPVTELR